MKKPVRNSTDSKLDFRRLLKFCHAGLPAMMQCLRQAVEIESPSLDKACIDRIAGFFAREIKRCGGKARLLPHPSAGAAVLATFWNSGRPRDAKSILLLGHHDTVWGAGTLRQMPFRISRGRAFGPGIFDMKGGVVQALWAIRALEEQGITPRSPVRLFLNPDEEVSSQAFRKQIMDEARSARCVLVLEPAAGGALKTARKGVGEFRITVRGRSTHAGINPRGGINAINELARQLIRIESFQNFRTGLTLNAGVIEGGTRSNVVPEGASACVDVRIPRLRDRAAIERKVYGLKPVLPGARLEITGGVNRPPLEHAMARELFQHARRVGKRLGMDLRETSTGGGSDGNFTASLGVPTLDGLGAVGEGAHARHEHIVVRELARRTALLAALLATL